ncbi:MAG: hypothetical protein KF799_09915 [Bdellovibrionales bacterium]|nr:hypothetical protein [Bdellovibrionales bacterium]
MQNSTQQSGKNRSNNKSVSSAGFKGKNNKSSERNERSERGERGGQRQFDGDRQESGKTIGAVIAENLAAGTQERVDGVMDQVSEYYEAAREYVNENPREAMMIGASLGMAAWALLFTKPGRQIFDLGAARAVPVVSQWISTTFNSQNRSQAV